MQDMIDAHLEHFERFRDRYPLERVHGVLAQLFMQHPTDGAVHLKLARFCAKLGLDEEARRFFEAAIQHGPADGPVPAEARCGLAGLLRSVADRHVEAARVWWRRRVMEEPGSAAAHAGHGDALLAAGRLDEAERAHAWADRLEPGHPNAALGLACIAERRSRPAEAERALARALAVHERSTALLEALAGLHERQGRFDEAAGACLRLLRITPYNPSVARRLSRAVQAQDWFEAALAVLAAPALSLVEPTLRRRFDALPTGPAGRRRVHFVSFAYGDAFEKAQVAMGESALRRGATHTLPWTRDDLTGTGFYARNRAVLDLRRGAGYWLWKPFIILQALLAAEEGDYVWYHDTGHVIDTDVTPVIEWAEACNDGIMPGIYLPCYASKDWTKRDCYVLMGCDEERYWNHCLIQPGWSFWRVCERSRRIVGEWLTHAVDPRILTDYPNTCGLPDLPSFIDHRHDQSVFTNVFVRNGLRSFGAPDDPLPRYPKDIRYLVERCEAFLAERRG